MEGNTKRLSAVTLCGTVLFWAVFAWGVFTVADAVWVAGMQLAMDRGQIPTWAAEVEQ